MEELFEEVYAPNTAEHIFTGKAYARAIIRAYIMAESAIAALLMELVQEKYSVNVTSLSSFYNKALAQELDDESASEMMQSDTFNALCNKFEAIVELLGSESRTAALWILYLKYVGIAKQFIFAERTSSWEFHLDVTSLMLNLFAATGHFNYAKCDRLYLQQMNELP